MTPPPLSVKDPVCGMTVNPATARGGSFEHAGTTYYFCNPRCRERFSATPDEYLAKVSTPRNEPETLPAAMPAQAGAEYTCPMHPEVVRVSPGSCPICGMALEPRHVSLQDAPNPEVASAAMAFSSVSVILNALRLQRASLSDSQAETLRLSRRHQTKPA